MSQLSDSGNQKKPALRCGLIRRSLSMTAWPTNACQTFFLQPVHGTARPWSKGFFHGFYQRDMKTRGYCTKWDAKKTSKNLMTLAIWNAEYTLKRLTYQLARCRLSSLICRRRRRRCWGLNANSGKQIQMCFGLRIAFWFWWDLCSPPHWIHNIVMVVAVVMMMMMMTTPTTTTMMLMMMMMVMMVVMMMMKLVLHVLVYHILHVHLLLSNYIFDCIRIIELPLTK